MVIYMKKMLTVIIPVYNDEKNIGRCIDSIVGQTYSNIDIIVVNDASTDNTIGVLRSYCKRHTITIINMEVNSGAAACRNAGIMAAQTPYVTFVDSDDWIDFGTYEKCVAQMNSEPDVIVYGLVYDYIMYNRRDKKYQYQYVYKMPGIFALKAYTHTMPNEIRITPIVNNKVYRKDFLLKQEILFDEKLRYQEDDVFTFEVLASADMVIFVDGCNYHYCQRNDSMIHHVSELSVRSFISAYLSLRAFLESRHSFETLKAEYYLKFKSSLLGVLKRIIDYEPNIEKRNSLIILLVSLLMDNYDMNSVLNTFDLSKLRTIM